jgi:hypothetical protein
MLLESDVIDATCNELESLGYVILQKLSTTQHGDDIIAENSSKEYQRISVEAKGETSSRQTSERYGKPFDNAQVKIHVAEALYKAVQVLSRPEEEGMRVLSAIALPKTKFHIRSINSIKPVIDQLGIVIFWILPDASVEFTSKSQL